MIGKEVYNDFFGLPCPRMPRTSWPSGFVIESKLEAKKIARQAQKYSPSLWFYINDDMTCIMGFDERLSRKDVVRSKFKLILHPL